MRNNKLVNIIIIIGIIFLIISLVFMLTNKKEVANHIIDIDYNEYSEIINKDEYSIILLTSTTCSHCKDYKPYVNYVADDYNLVIYNLNIDKLKYDEYMNIHDKYEATKNNYIGNSPSLRTPTTIIVKNNEEIDSISNNIGYTGFIELLKKNNIIK